MKDNGPTNDPMRDMIRALDNEQLRVLAGEAGRELRDRTRTVKLEDITFDRLQDPAFAAQVRAEIDQALREL